MADANEKHLPPWAEACTAGGVHNTPLSPYVDKDILKGAHLHLDGSKLRKLGYQYQVSAPSRENIVQVRQASGRISYR